MQRNGGKEFSVRGSLVRVNNARRPLFNQIDISGRGCVKPFKVYFSPSSPCVVVDATIKITRDRAAVNRAA